MGAEAKHFDRHIGARIRLRRLLIRMSQETLGQKIGVTFQQVQKYENGLNRVSASRLGLVAATLGVEVGYFFDSMELDQDLEPSPGGPKVGDDAVIAFISSREGVALASAWVSLANPIQRHAILALVTTLAAEQADRTRKETLA